MIEKIDGEFVLYCDVCGEIITTEPTFNDCVESKKEFGIKSQFLDGEWQDVCLECQGVE